jgi:hypothetical protein
MSPQEISNMARPSKAEQAEKAAKVQELKRPVAAAMEKRAVILEALAQHDQESAKAIEALCEARGEMGPFAFGDDSVIFRKNKGGTYDVHPYVAKIPV